MKQIQNHLVGVEQGSHIVFSDYESDGKMWVGEGLRIRRRAVRFSESYRSAPAVHLTMSMWDMGAETIQRADISAANIDENGFLIVFRTWGDTRVARVRADWLAIGELKHEDEWQLY